MVKIRQPVQRFYEHINDGLAIQKRWTKKGGRVEGLHGMMAELGVESFILLPLKFVDPTERLRLEERLRRWMSKTFNAGRGKRYTWVSRELGNLASVDKGRGKEITLQAREYISSLHINATSTTLIHFLLKARGHVSKEIYARLFQKVKDVFWTRLRVRLPRALTIPMPVGAMNRGKLLNEILTQGWKELALPYWLKKYLRAVTRLVYTRGKRVKDLVGNFRIRGDWDIGAEKGIRGCRCREILSHYDLPTVEGCIYARA